ncbi:class I SAM-dependent methyltransferase [Streptomyces sp. NPDC050560]|uniref:class I SAM-dependent methyltransferase n=1 Tax=Streptomyces sp. NPDC050560 TaxID=3365630 RepID=UPI0037A3CD84
MTRPLSPEVRAGHAVYNRLTLAVYDFALYEVSCRYTWKCPKGKLLELFGRNVSASHLDVGVGTGYLLDRCQKSGAVPRVTLVDLNETALRYAAKRLARFRPVAVRANALEPLPLPERSQESASMNFLLHCLPGSFEEKARVFDRVAACVREGGRIFGATVLSAGVPVGRGARFQMGRLNRSGVFHNADDGAEALDDALARRFSTYELRMEGCCGLFEATVG